MSLTSYLKETRVELKHVHWPSRQATINFTIIVIGVTVVCAALLGLFDFIFTFILKTII